MKVYIRHLPLYLLHYFFSIFTLFGICSTTKAQEQKRFIVYDVKNGLSQNSVHAIIRDKDGLVWIGTQDGLNSFDGTHFTTYKHSAEDSNSISDQFVLSIKEAGNGKLWVGTRNGLNLFNKRTKTFKRIYIDKKEQHLFQSEYDKFYVQNDRKVIIKKNGLYLLDPVSDNIQRLQAKDEDLIDWLILPNYNCWLFSKTKGAVFYDDIRKKFPGKISKAQLTNIPSYAAYQSLAINDSIYCLYNFLESKEIFFFNTRTGELEGKLKYPGTANYLTYSHEKIFLCTTTGLYEKPADSYNNWEYISTNPHNGLPPGSFLCKYVDDEGYTWLGTAGSGVAVSNPQFNYFTSIPTPIKNDRITGVCFSGEDLYMSTHSGLYSIQNFSNATNQTFLTILKNSNISAICSNKDGQIWLALYDQGLQLVSKTGKILKTYRLPERAYKSRVMNLLIDSEDRLIVSTTYGVFTLPSKLQNHKVHIDTSIIKNLMGNYYMTAFEDKDKNIWLAGNVGINVINTHLNPVMSFESKTDTQSFLKRTIITSVTQDKDGAMWIASIRNGVFKYQHNKSKHYTHTSGLSSDIAYNVICDNKSRIWVTTSTDLNVYDQSQDAFKPIGPFDGVPKTSFSFGSIIQHKSYIIIGGTGSLLVCDADNYVIKQEQLTAFIGDVKVNGQSIRINKNGFSIMPDNKLIRFEFAYNPAFYTGNVVYQYRLRGADSNWINLTPGTNAISYTGLPYKTLFMEVRAAGSINNLNKAAVYSLKIKSTPPFYKTTLFAIAVIALVIFLVSMLVIYYNKQQYKKQLAVLKMEKELQKERFRIGRDLHDNIGAYTSALIAGLNRIKSTNDKDVENISDLKDYGANIMGLLRETIWMLNAAELTVTAFTDRFINYAMRINKNYSTVDLNFKEDIENDKKLQPTIMLNLFRILQEALQNACKHSSASIIQFSVSSKDLLHFSITDNGKGFNGEGKKDHYGISNMKQRAAEAGFYCTIVSDASGTTVSIVENTANA